MRASNPTCMWYAAIQVLGSHYYSNIKVNNPNTHKQQRQTKISFSHEKPAVQAPVVTSPGHTNTEVPQTPQQQPTNPQNTVTPAWSTRVPEQGRTNLPSPPTDKPPPGSEWQNILRALLFITIPAQNPDVPGSSRRPSAILVEYLQTMFAVFLDTVHNFCHGMMQLSPTPHPYHAL